MSTAAELEEYLKSDKHKAAQHHIHEFVDSLDRVEKHIETNEDLEDMYEDGQIHLQVPHHLTWNYQPTHPMFKLAKEQSEGLLDDKIKLTIDPSEADDILAELEKDIDAMPANGETAEVSDLEVEKAFDNMATMMLDRDLHGSHIKDSWLYDEKDLKAQFKGDMEGLEDDLRAAEAMDFGEIRNVREELPEEYFEDQDYKFFNPYERYDFEDDRIYAPDILPMDLVLANDKVCICNGV